MVVLKFTKITVPQQIEEMLWLITLLCQHDCFNNCESFEVFEDIICKYNLQSVITLNSKPPGHSVVCVVLCVFFQGTHNLFHALIKVFH